jgi:alcohol dehydrogenase
MRFSDSPENWNFHNATSIDFGRGKRSLLGPEIAGKKVLAVSSPRGKKQFASDHVLGPLASDFTWVTSVKENPGMLEMDEAALDLKGLHFDLILAFGGGSAIDFAKVLSAIMSIRSEHHNVLDLVSHPQLIRSAKLIPIYAMPTTAGTGSEVTPFATVWDHDNKKKLSVSSASLYPTRAIIDPELTDSLPLDATLASGLDALNQAFESVWNKNSSPMTMSLAARSIDLALQALPSLRVDITDGFARNLMAESALLAGICISQTRTAICHSISYPLTARFSVPHGIAAAFTMTEVFNQCLLKDPKLFDPIILATRHDSAELLRDEVGGLMGLLGVRRKVSQLTGGLGVVAEIQHEMLTSDRSENFILKIDDEGLHQILKNSFQ